MTWHKRADASGKYHHAESIAYDYVDVFEAPDLETAMRVSALAWKEFKKIVHDLPAPAH